MHIQDVFDKHTTTFSFEFFPPKSEAAAESLYATIGELKTLKPSFVSVTYGAGGTTRQRTHDLVIRVRNELGVTTVPHLTCVCHSEQDIQDILQRYADEGVENILALGGDPPRDLENYNKAADAFQQAADLVKYIRQFPHSDSRGFGVGIAGFPEGHPGTPNRLKEMDYLKAKCDAGADYIVTQLFFNNDDFYDFRERCGLAGITIPIIAGIMPITSAKGMKRMAELAAGARYPAKLLRAIDRCGGDEDAVKRVGVHWATEQCRDLLDNKVAGIHFYTLNQSGATREIYANLGVPDSVALGGGSAS
ncbi:MAG: methylenetetrahydrofolate reductase [NAD(P)H] [Phycisphaeraceae bacterium]|nr:methylenetetrahydrofolate reductase [NAD(P)H] [Phycisphaeraceae bacterium]